MARRLPALLGPDLLRNHEFNTVGPTALGPWQRMEGRNGGSPAHTFIPCSATTCGADLHVDPASVQADP